MPDHHRKIFVLDTSVILHDFNALQNFEEHDVAIPITVLEELDQFKKGNSVLNLQAREFIRQLDKLSTRNMLHEWIPLDGPSRGKLRVVVEDRTAVYPVRIDPTFSDADWIGLGVGVAGTDNAVRALAVDAAGALYIGGDFSTVGGLTVNCIAKWNGSSWLNLGSGMNGNVYALAVSGANLYAGGFFSTARAMVTRWRSPPERRIPRSPATV